MHFSKFCKAVSSVLVNSEEIEDEYWNDYYLNYKNNNQHSTFELTPEEWAEEYFQGYTLECDDVMLKSKCQDVEFLDEEDE